MNYTSEQYSEAQKFCQVYFGTEEGVRLRAVSEGEGCPQEIVKILDGSFEDKFIQAWSLNGKGYAIYYMPQKYTDGEWQEKYANLLGFYGVVVDLDGADVKKAVEHVVKDLGCPRPTIIVESSSGHYQVCWRFSKVALVSELSVDTFNTLAFNLAAAMGGDFNAARATQPFRLPGFINQKVGRDEWVCRIAWINEDEGKEGVDWQQMVAWSGMPQVAGEAGRAAGERRGAEWSGQEVDLAAVRLGEVKVGEGDRHRVLIRLATQLCEEFDSEEKVTSELDKVVSSSFTGAGEFLEGGKRREELRKAVRDAGGYVEQNKERERAAKEIAEKEKDEIGQQLAENTPFKGVITPFQFDFGRGALEINKYTEASIAERVLQRFGGEVCRLDDTVLGFDHIEKVWKEQRGAGVEIQHKVLEIIKDAVKEEAFMRECCTDARGRVSITAVRSAHNKFLSGRFIHTCCSVVKGHSWVRNMEPGDFDAVEGRILCKNGVLELDAPGGGSGGGVREARAEDYLLKRGGAEWKGEDEECPGWEQFVKEIYGGDMVMVSFMQEVFGYSLGGSVKEERIFCHLGDGCNGKSKLLWGLRTIAGGYCKMLGSDDLVTKRGGYEKAFERIGAKVMGSRVGIADDLDVGARWNEGFVKMLTGRVIGARLLYRELIEVPNRTKFHLGLNSTPDVEAENHGIVRRLCIIPYDVRFEANARKETELGEMIEREKSGILAWAVRGYRRWKERGGLVYPEKTKLAVEQYVEEKFPIESIVRGLYEPGDEWVPIRIISEEIQNTAAKTGMARVEISNDTIGRTFKNLGFRRDKKRTDISSSENGWYVKRKITVDLQAQIRELL